ncbi:hypothetical protein BU17DRAFT_70477 [Hysterangium stoloniferum]|nr:hypothetical protein BU17DRAFT_70477 [Hysterangium stoloniferum]
MAPKMPTTNATQLSCGELYKQQQEKYYASLLLIKARSNSDPNSSEIEQRQFNVPHDSPKTPDNGPAKRPRFYSPNKFMDIDIQGKDVNTFHLELPQEPSVELYPNELPPIRQSSTSNTKGMDIFEARPFPDASTVHGTCETVFQKLHRTTTTPDLPAFPFADEAEWSLVEWLGTCGISNAEIDAFLKTKWISEMEHQPSFKTAQEMWKRIDEFLQAGPEWHSKEVVLPEAPNEPQILYYCDLVECLSYLEQNPAFEDAMNYEPILWYSNEELSDAGRVYGDIYTGDAWLELQTKVPPGVTVLPAILASDATHVTNFSGDGKVHPIYASSGHIDSTVRNQPSKLAFMLVGFIPVCKFGKTEFPTKTKDNQFPGRLQARLFHTCMKIVVEPLRHAGKIPVWIPDPKGLLREHQIFLVLYLADKEEQTLIACLGKNSCTTCLAETKNLGELHICSPRTAHSILEKICTVRRHVGVNADTWTFITAAKEAQLSGVEYPFWEDLPHTDICKVICNDVLHGLHKAFYDHTAKWCRNIIGDFELDKRFRRLPKEHGYRHFSSGISKISQWSGREWKDLERSFLPAIYGATSNEIVQAVRAELDFIFTAQWTHLTEADLQRLTEFDEIYDLHREAFVTEGGRTLKRGDDHWAIPKKHCRKHYPEHIRWVGATNNYSTEISERYHIDLVKSAFEHTNHKDYITQMITWLTRQDKIQQHSLYLRWLNNDWTGNLLQTSSDTSNEEICEINVNLAESEEERLPQSNQLSVVRFKPKLHALQTKSSHAIAKRPPFSQVPIQKVTDDYSIPQFEMELKKYLIRLKNKDITTRQLNQNALTFHLPEHWNTLAIWSRVSIELPIVGVYNGSNERCGVLARLKTSKSSIPCFDTVVIDEQSDIGTQQNGMNGLRIGRLKLIFRAARDPMTNKLITGQNEKYEPLAYVEWFSKPKAETVKYIDMYEVKQLVNKNNQKEGAMLLSSKISQIKDLASS